MFLGPARRLMQLFWLQLAGGCAEMALITLLKGSYTAVALI